MSGIPSMMRNKLGNKCRLECLKADIMIQKNFMKMKTKTWAQRVHSRPKTKKNTKSFFKNRELRNQSEFDKENQLNVDP